MTMKVVIVATMGMLMTVRIMMIRQVPRLTWKVSIARGSGKLTKWWWCPHMRVGSQGWWGINIPHVRRHHLQETRDAAKKNRRRQQTTKEQNWDDSYSASFSYTPKHTHDCQWLEMFGFGDGQTCKKRDKQAILIFRGFLVRLEEKWSEEKKLPSLDQSVPPSSRHNDSRDETYIRDCKIRRQHFFLHVKPKSQSS